jgi:branched-chain amino acid transport system permease protein
MSIAMPSLKVETGSKASSLALLVAFAVLALGLAAPFLVSRGTVQDLFFILTMLVLAQSWNLLAGYAGLISVGQQVFVGFGAYAMFGAVILLGVDPLSAILIAGVLSMLLAIPTAFFTFRLYGPYFAIGTWVVAEVVRLLFAQWKALGGGTGTSLPREAVRDMAGVSLLRDLFGMKPAEASDAITYWLALLLAAATIGFIYRLLRSKQGLGLAAVRDNEQAARAVGVDARRMTARGAMCRRPASRRTPPSPSPTGRPMSSSSSSSAASAPSRDRSSASSCSSFCRTSWPITAPGIS